MHPLTYNFNLVHFKICFKLECRKISGTLNATCLRMLTIHYTEIKSIPKVKKGHDTFGFKTKLYKPSEQKQ